jgi:signal transduction histidine kinase/CheY-like chemotaxis protein
MRFHTKLFLGWVALTLALWGGAFFAIRHTVEKSFDRMAAEAFVGVSRGLQDQTLERVNNTRQACELVVNIPELRALIAEQNYELGVHNQASLRERLDYVNGVADKTFVLALNGSATPVAQNGASPWSSLAELQEFLETSPFARRLVERTFQAQKDGAFGLWAYRGKVYEVAAAPLIFQDDEAPEARQAEGVLVMGKELTDAVLKQLGRRYGCEITVLVQERIAATSLPDPLKREFAARFSSLSAETPGLLPLGRRMHRVASERLNDPSSGKPVGAVAILQDQAPAEHLLAEVRRNVLLLVLGSVGVAAVASYFFSRAITRPIQALASDVRGVGQGDLNRTFHAQGGAELSVLAGAFNDMVGRLRGSRDELERLLDEARTAAKREHLLHEVAQQINQRLDVQSSRRMFLDSVGQLFPDVELAIYRYHPDTQSLALLESLLDAEAGAAHPASERTTAPLTYDLDTIHRLACHELVYHTDCWADGEASRSLCLAPMLAESKLLGVIAAIRNRRDGFSADEREFLQSLADHFAIALANAQVHEELRKAYSDLRANQRQTIQTERLRALGQMASGIAHDFNNHLTGVLAFLEMALDRDDLDEELRSWLEMSRESSMSAAEVVTLLRNFYRRDTNETLDRVDLNKIAAATISLTRPRWFDMPRRHGLVVNVVEDFAPSAIVHGNAAELRDALTNLLFNAVDAMPGGGQIVLRTREAGAEIVVEVQDAGQGMTDEVREQCLEPFFSTKGAQGTGLGLSMVHGVVERCRGRLEIDTRLGKGTTVRLFLPRAEPFNAPESKHDLPDAQAPRRILCVDDDPRILKSLAGMLGQLGHNVTAVSTGAEAIIQMSAEPYDVVITDLGMPGVDGREVARSARRLSPHTRVVLFTGWADRLKAEGDLPEGVDELLGKPVTKARLQQAIAGTHSVGQALRA